MCVRSRCDSEETMTEIEDCAKALGGQMVESEARQSGSTRRDGADSLERR